VTPEGHYCRTWTRWGNAQEGCAEVYRKDDTLNFIVVRGKIGRDPQFQAAYQKGNPFEL